MAGSARETFAEARTGARVLRMPNAVFLKAVRASNSVLYEVTKQIGKRLLRYQARLEDLAFRDVRSRLARILLSLAEEHGQDTARGLPIGLPLSQEEIATLIGSTRQSVSTILREMKASGFVVRRGRHIVITNPAGLRSLSARTSSSRVGGSRYTHS
jgi:CRP/FNR family transcriptional regulator